jgi:hypothetical protein
MSTDFNDFDMYNGKSGSRKKFDLFNDIFKIQNIDANVGSIVNHETLIVSFRSNLSNTNQTQFNNFNTFSILEAKDSQIIFGSN